MGYNEQQIRQRITSDLMHEHADRLRALAISAGKQVVQTERTPQKRIAKPVFKSPYSQMLFTPEARIGRFHTLLSKYFVASGMLDRLLKIRLENIPQQKITRGEMQDHAQQLLDAFINRVDTRYNEADWRLQTVPTGDEYEFFSQDFGERIRKAYVEHAESLGITEAKLHEQLDEISKSDDPTDEMVDGIKYSELVSRLQSSLPIAELFDFENFGTFRAQLPHASGYRRGFPVSKPEIDTFPTYNPFIRSLEFLILLKLGVRMAEISMHTTAAHVAVDPEHLEATTATTLGYLGGFFTEELSREEAEAFRNGRYGQTEDARKPTKLSDGTRISIPYVKGRRPGLEGMTDTMVTYDRPYTTAVEHRSVPPFADDVSSSSTPESHNLLHFGKSKLMRKITDILVFNTLTSSLIARKQGGIFSDPKQEIQAAKLWKKVEGTVAELLATIGLAPLLPEERYKVVETGNDYNEESELTDKQVSRISGYQDLPEGAHARRAVRGLLQDIAKELFGSSKQIPPILKAYFGSR